MNSMFAFPIFFIPSRTFSEIKNEECSGNQIEIMSRIAASFFTPLFGRSDVKGGDKKPIAII